MSLLDKWEEERKVKEEKESLERSIQRCNYYFFIFILILMNLCMVENEPRYILFGCVGLFLSIGCLGELKYKLNQLIEEKE